MTTSKNMNVRALSSMAVVEAFYKDVAQAAADQPYSRA